VNEELIAELNRDVALSRVDAAEIHRRARVGALVEQIARNERTCRRVAAATEIVQWLTFDGVAAALAWSATGSVLVAALAATAVHLGGMAAGAARAARA
jgi:hypothetical protein